MKGILEQTIQSQLGTNVYTPKKVPAWTSSIVENTLKTLQNQQKPYKWIVTAIIMQRTGAGLHTASTCFWDTKTDGSCTIRWENKSMHCIATVFALHI